MTDPSARTGSGPSSTAGLVALEVNGEPVSTDASVGTLLDLLRDHLGLTAAKDGCSPQGQCGCCTVLVDGQPRVACVTPVRRLSGRQVTTLEGLDSDRRELWAEALCRTGGSQCGFCTPGIIMRLEGLTGIEQVESALMAHLCRCTGWQTIAEAAQLVGGGEAAQLVGGRHQGEGARDLTAASRRATIEGRSQQAVGTSVVLGEVGFAADTVPRDALRAVLNSEGAWVVGETLAEARANAGKTQGRRTTAAPQWPIEVPEGEWAATLQTTWVEPAYLETDASWCEPGGAPATPLANGGAFGAKTGEGEALIAVAARQLADHYGRTVLATFSREDSVRFGAKRPPVAGAIRADGSGVLRVAADRSLAGVQMAVETVAPGLSVELVEVAGPPVSASLRAAVWAEAALLAGAVNPGTVRSPDGAEATARVVHGGIEVDVRCGQILDPVVLRSYCIGAAHMAWSWVTSEALSVDEAGQPLDLTIRSFGVVRAKETPLIRVTLHDGAGPPLNGSDAVFAAVAAAVWSVQGCPPRLPTGRMQP